MKVRELIEALEALDDDEEYVWAVNYDQPQPGSTGTTRRSFEVEKVMTGPSGVTLWSGD